MTINPYSSEALKNDTQKVKEIDEIIGKLTEKQYQLQRKIKLLEGRNPFPKGEIKWTKFMMY